MTLFLFWGYIGGTRAMLLKYSPNLFTHAPKVPHNTLAFTLLLLCAAMAFLAVNSFEIDERWKPIATRTEGPLGWNLFPTKPRPFCGVKRSMANNIFSTSIGDTYADHISKARIKLYVNQHILFAGVVSPKGDIIAENKRIDFKYCQNVLR